jgi:glycosyltransferase involved in cell wall biosynthesis
MNNLPLISVVIPCLNRAHFLAPTLESVLQQGYPRIECIVVDGGSTDGTREILRSFGDRIRWVSEPDQGHADAINKGWRLSQGEILAWLNADDLWVVPDAVSQVVAFMQANPAVDVAYGDCAAVDIQENLVGMSYLHDWDLEYAVEYCDHCIPQPAAFIRRRILEKVGWLDTAFYQKKDHELWLRIGLAGKIRYLPVTLAYARRMEGLSQDGRTAAPACVQVTRKFYSLADIPPQLQQKKWRAFSNSYLRGMHYAYGGGRLWGLIHYYALRAVIADPSNILRVIRDLHRYWKNSAARGGYRWLETLVEFPWLVKAGWHKIKRLILERPHFPNLLGDRDIEWSWVGAQMPLAPGEALDFGAGCGHLALVAAQRGFNVTAVDLGVGKWHFVHPRLHIVQGDLLKLPLPQEHFDLVINCSTVEHVGLAGRYGVIKDRPDGDLEAMGRLWGLMKPGGVMLLTIPVGKDAVFHPFHRIYGMERLPLLLKGYKVEKEAFWVKNGNNRWVLSSREKALNFEASAGSCDALQDVYALGCFSLKREFTG